MAGCHIKHADMARAIVLMGRTRIGNIEFAFIGREGQPIGFDKIIADDGDGTRLRVNPIDMRGADFAFCAFPLVIRIDAISGVGEPDGAIGFDNHIIG